MPKLIALARARWSSVTASTSIPRDLGRRPPVDVVAALERLHEPLVPGVVGQDAQLDLGVVGGEQHAALRGNEHLADPHPLLAADRDVLDVRIGRREAPRGGAELVERRMDPTRPLVHQGRQRDDVGGEQLREPAVGEDALRKLVLRGELFQHALVRRVAGLGLLDRGQLELLEEDLSAAASARRRGTSRRPARGSAPRSARAPARTRPRGPRGPPRRRERPRAPCGRGRGSSAARPRRRARRARPRRAAWRVAREARESRRPGARPSRRVSSAESSAAARALAPRPASSSHVWSLVPRYCAAMAASDFAPVGSISWPAISTSKCGTASSTPCSANSIWMRFASHADPGRGSRRSRTAAARRRATSATSIPEGPTGRRPRSPRPSRTPRRRRRRPSGPPSPKTHISGTPASFARSATTASSSRTSVSHSNGDLAVGGATAPAPFPSRPSQQPREPQPLVERPQGVDVGLAELRRVPAERQRSVGPQASRAASRAGRRRRAPRARCARASP